MEREQALKIIETLLYMTDHPLTEKEIVEVLEIKAYDEAAVRDMVAEIAQKYESLGSPLQVLGVAGGVQVATRPELAGWVRKLFKERLTVKLSPSALETLAIIAYKQPVTKADVERIRGVEASGVIDTLLERRLLKVVGRKEALGRPWLYGTTQEFLRQFGLKHLVDLPDISTLVTTAIPTQTELPVPQEFGPASDESSEVLSDQHPSSQTENLSDTNAVTDHTEPVTSTPDEGGHNVSASKVEGSLESSSVNVVVENAAPELAAVAPEGQSNNSDSIESSEGENSNHA